MIKNKFIVKVVVIFIIFVISFTLFARDAVEITSGAENISMLKKAKPISIFVTFDGLMWGSITVEEKKAEYEADGKEFDYDEIKSEFFRIMNKNIKVGKKWGFKQIDNKEDATKGFLFVLEYKKHVPAGLAAKGYATLSVFKVSDLENPILIGELQSLYIAKMVWDMAPKKQMSNMGELYVKELAKFMKKQVK